VKTSIGFTGILQYREIEDAETFRGVPVQQTFASEPPISATEYIDLLTPDTRQRLLDWRKKQVK
jgi:hypothetical protein